MDKKVNGEIVFKTRDSIESQVYPTSKIIGDLSTSDTELFVDTLDSLIMKKITLLLL